MAQFSGTVTLGKDPELKTSQDGQTIYAKFGGAWSESSKDKTGQWMQGPTIWLHVTLFGRQAKNLVQTVRKGDRVNIVGRIKPELWSSDQGEETVITVLADSVSPDLVFASAQVQKNPKANSQGYGQSPAQQQGNFGGRPADDPWSSAPQSGGFGTPGEPPF